MNRVLIFIIQTALELLDRTNNCFVLPFLNSQEKILDSIFEISQSNSFHFQEPFEDHHPRIKILVPLLLFSVCCR